MRLILFIAILCYLNILVPPLGKRPVWLKCPRCKLLVMTRVKEEISSTAYICCMLMIVIGYVGTYFMKLNNHLN